MPKTHDIPEAIDSSETSKPMHELLASIRSYQGPVEQFLPALLQWQCKLLDAEGGGIFLPGPKGYQPHVIWPEPKAGQSPPGWAAPAGQALASRPDPADPLVAPIHCSDDLYDDHQGRTLLAVQLGGSESAGAVACVIIRPVEADRQREYLQQLDLSISLWTSYALRLRIDQRQKDFLRMQGGMEVLAATNEQESFHAAAMALCNEMTSQYQADRVSVGLLKGRYIKLKAMSHTEKFSRKMQLIQNIEAAMEEAIDQDAEVTFPELEQAKVVCRASKNLSTQHGPSVVLVLPLRLGGEVVGALCLERSAEVALQPGEAETIRLACDLATPRLLELYHRDRWFGARLTHWLEGHLGRVLSPSHTWLKLLVLVLIGAVLVLFFAKGTYRAQANFEFQPSLRRIIPAPFQGNLHSVEVEPGDAVRAGQVLARLDDADLRIELSRDRSEQASYLKEAEKASSENKIAQAQIARARAEAIEARIELLTHRIKQATIRAPIDGTILKGDLRRQIGSPLDKGNTLFEIAPLDSLRADLFVPEDDIADVHVGQQGDLATAGYAHIHTRFVVERIDPVARVKDGKNVFRVRVRLEEVHPWMRPGLEGLARIRIGQRSYAWLLSHELIDWVRMRLWL